MEKKTTTVKTEDVLLNFICGRLEMGITDGVTEKEFYNFLHYLLEEVNRGFIESYESTMAIFENLKDYNYNEYVLPKERESFSTIAKKVIATTSRRYNENIKGLDLQNGVIYPNYNFKASDIEKYRLDKTFGLWVSDYVKSYYKKDQGINDQCVKTLHLSDKHSDDSSDIDFNLSKLIGAYYVNDLIERYLKNGIKNGYWPKQCDDIDEYIFNRDIANVIDAYGTKKRFTLAYYQAIRVVLELLKKRESSDEKLMFSNDSNNFLAYANFLKFTVPEDLSKLSSYRYKKNYLHNASIDVSVIDNEAHFKTSECTFSDPYGEWGDNYKKNEGIIDDAPVKVMERRIGEVLKK